MLRFDLFLLLLLFIDFFVDFNVLKLYGISLLVIDYSRLFALFNADVFLLILLVKQGSFLAFGFVGLVLLGHYVLKEVTRRDDLGTPNYNPLRARLPLHVLQTAYLVVSDPS